MLQTSNLCLGVELLVLHGRKEPEQIPAWHIEFTSGQVVNFHSIIRACVESEFLNQKLTRRNERELRNWNKSFSPYYTNCHSLVFYKKTVCSNATAPCVEWGSFIKM